MKRLGCASIGLIGLLGLVIILALWAGSWYNGTITTEEDVNGQWANVESSYQRRNDLIPNIVATANKYAEFEQETLTAVIEARSKATQITLEGKDLTEENLAAFSQAQGQVRSGLDRLLATFEAYPNLKANENFSELINELERTENRINVERNRFNDQVRVYQKRVRRFPGTILAGLFGFEEKDYFKADEGASQAPDVKTLFE